MKQEVKYSPIVKNSLYLGYFSTTEEESIQVNPTIIHQQAEEGEQTLTKLNPPTEKVEDCD